MFFPEEIHRRTCVVVAARHFVGRARGRGRQHRTTPPEVSPESERKSRTLSPSNTRCPASSWRGYDSVPKSIPSTFGHHLFAKGSRTGCTSERGSCIWNAVLFAQWMMCSDSAVAEIFGQTRSLLTTLPVHNSPRASLLPFPTPSPLLSPPFRAASSSATSSSAVSRASNASNASPDARARHSRVSSLVLA